MRPRIACRVCEQIRQAPAIDLPLPKVMASSALLAHLIVSRFVDHVPWNRQSVILRRQGIDIDRDVMSRWARKLAWLMAPLGERLLAYILEAPKIHGDDTPVTLLGNGNGSAIARFWVYLRHGWSSGDMEPPAVAYRFSADRGGHHPAAHLANYRGYLQADGFAGYNALYRDPKTKAPRDVVEVGCWAHARRKFTDVLDKTPHRSRPKPWSGSRSSLRSSARSRARRRPETTGQAGTRLTQTRVAAKLAGDHGTGTVI